MMIKISGVMLYLPGLQDFQALSSTYPANVVGKTQVMQNYIHLAVIKQKRDLASVNTSFSQVQKFLGAYSPLLSPWNRYLHINVLVFTFYK